MSRGKKPTTELEHLAAGLGQAEDPYLIKELLGLRIEDLAAEMDKEMRYTAVSLIRAGRFCMAMKKKLGHGHWEDYVTAKRWSPSYVRLSMKLLEVVARFPQLMHLPPGRVTDRLLNLPMPKIEEAIGDLPPEAVKKLTPWDLEEIYQRKAVENQKAKRNPKAPSREVELPSELTNLVNQVTSALNRLIEYAIPAKERDICERYLREIEVLWNRAAYNLRDPEHKTVPWWERNPAQDDVSEEEHAG